MPWEAQLFANNFLPPATISIPNSTTEARKLSPTRFSLLGPKCQLRPGD